jgi:hypothetical protein
MKIITEQICDQTIAVHLRDKFGNTIATRIHSGSLSAETIDEIGEKMISELHLVKPVLTLMFEYEAEDVTVIYLRDQFGNLVEGEYGSNVLNSTDVSRVRHSMQVEWDKCVAAL